MTGRTVLLRAAEADMGPHDDQAGMFGICFGFLYSGFQRIQIFGTVYPQYLPAVAFEAGLYIFRKGNFGVPFYGNLIVIIQVNQLAQAHRTRQGSRFRSHPFHQVAVGNQSVGVVIDNRKVRLVVFSCQHTFCQSHACPHGKPVAQRTGRYVYPGSDAIFRMARGLAPPLPKVFKVIYGNFVAGQMQHSVQQRRTVARGQHEPVPVEPFGICRIVAHKLIPQGKHQRRGAQGEPRMP